MAAAPRALVHNWRLKLSALGLSVFLWALVHEPGSEETFSSVPVRVEMSDTTWTLATPAAPPFVELRLSGPPRELIRLAREGPTLRVPIAAVGSRDTVITLQRDWVELPRRAGVSVESVSPSTLALAFEPAVTRTLPVSLRIRGQLPRALSLSSALALNPETVQVRGPESRLRGLDSLPLQPFDLSEVTESGLVPLVPDTSGLGPVSLSPPDVVVGVRVEPLEEWVLDGIVVEADLPPDSPFVSLEPASIRLRLTGARSLVAAVEVSRLRVSVSEQSLQRMQPGEERVVRLRIDGVPPLVEARPSVEVVTARRLPDARPATPGGGQ